MEENETMPSLENPSESYFLATGDAGRSRLHLLHAVYGPSTEALLTAIGLHAGMRVVDIGCGIGLVTIWLAQHVGPTGQVVGVDMSAAQLEVARQEAATVGVTNVVWHEASAYAPGLPPATFDLVYCRFLLEHLPAPEAALRAMDALLKPGGLLVCEALDVASLTTDPPQPAFARVAELICALHVARHADGCLGPKVHRLFRTLGYGVPQVAVQQPVCLMGDAKRLWEYSFLETAPVMVQEGVTTAAEVTALQRELLQVAMDDTILVAHARKVQTWASKPAVVPVS